jgi:hypothetical protein
MNNYEYLDKESAQKAIENNLYFSSFNENEIKYRTNGLNPIIFYKNGVLEFDENEKRIISKYISIILNIFKKSNITVPYFNFIKMQNDIDWAFPFTIGNSIVLRQENIVKNENINKKSNEHWNLHRYFYDKPFLYTLAHELIHIIQRNPTNDQYLYFMNLYKSWGFNKVESQLFDKIDRFNMSPFNFTEYISESIPKLISNENITYITNPDGYNFNYIIKLLHNSTNWKFYTPVLILHNNKPTKALQEIKITLYNYLLTRNIIEINSTNMRIHFPTYENLDNLDNPNEMSAYIISKQLVDRFL